MKFFEAKAPFQVSFGKPRLSACFLLSQSLRPCATLRSNFHLPQKLHQPFRDNKISNFLHAASNPPPPFSSCHTPLCSANVLSCLIGLTLRFTIYSASTVRMPSGDDGVVAKAYAEYKLATRYVVHWIQCQHQLLILKNTALLTSTKAFMDTARVLQKKYCKLTITYVWYLYE